MNIKNYVIALHTVCSSDQRFVRRSLKIRRLPFLACVKHLSTLYVHLYIAHRNMISTAMVTIKQTAHTAQPM